jgi:hypothetical protein
MAHTTNYDVADHFLAYFMNDDKTGMTDEDEAAVVAFERAETKGIVRFHWSYETDESGAFGTCEITGLGANLATLTLVNMDEVRATA